MSGTVNDTPYRVVTDNKMNFFNASYVSQPTTYIPNIGGKGEAKLYTSIARSVLETWFDGQTIQVAQM
ncbi:MAG: hypothetical protein H8D23_10980 [Candidatus Brocadiales bacterium]|nr:hypothetical protein [Candidatus Brocadiales bacterium]